MRTATSRAVDRPRRHEQGASLLELLVVVVILTALTSVVGFVMSRSMTDRPLDRAETQLSRDLRSALAEARASRPVHLTANETGYRLGETRPWRTFPEGVSADWALATPSGWRPVGDVALEAAPSPLHLRVDLSHDGASRTLRIEPVSGRVVHD